MLVCASKVGPGRDGERFHDHGGGDQKNDDSGDEGSGGDDKSGSGDKENGSSEEEGGGDGKEDGFLDLDSLLTQQERRTSHKSLLNRLYSLFATSKI